VQGQRLIAQDRGGYYLGEVEPKYALRLTRLIEGGNRYSAVIGSMGEGEAKVFIRETHQHPSQAGCPSFPPEGVEGLQAPEEPDEEPRRLEYSLEPAEELTENGEEVVKEEKEEDVFLSSGFHEVTSIEEPAAGEKDGDWGSKTDQD